MAKDRAKARPWSIDNPNRQLRLRSARPQDPAYPSDTHKPIVPIDLLDDEQPRDHPHPHEHARQREEDERDREDGVASAHGRVFRKCCVARRRVQVDVELATSWCRQSGTGVKLADMAMVGFQRSCTTSKRSC